MLAAILLTVALAQPIQVLTPGTGVVGAEASGTCPGTLTPDHCYAIALTGILAANQTAHAAVFVPSGTSLGTVVLMNGGGATVPVDVNGASSQTMVTDLVASGRVVVELYFGIPTGGTQPGWQSNPTKWANGGGGMMRAAGRGVGAFTAIRDNSTMHPTGPMCVAAQSGSGVLVAYAVTHFRLGSLFKAIVTGGGPAMVHEEQNCYGRELPSYAPICDTRQLTGTGAGCNGIPSFVDDAWGWDGASGECARQSDGDGVPWHNDSVVSPGADYRLPAGVTWRFIFGATDHPDVAVVQARVFQDQLGYYNGGTPWTEVQAAATPHNIYTTTAGAQQVVTYMESDCL